MNKYKLYHIVVLLLISQISYAQVGFSKCKTDLLRLFEFYENSVQDFDKGKEVFQMEFVQTTNYLDGTNLKSTVSEVEVVSDGYVKYMSTNGTRICSDTIFQVMIDDNKKTITLGIAVKNNQSMSDAFSFVDSLQSDELIITCMPADKKNTQFGYRFTPKEVIDSKIKQSYLAIDSNGGKMLNYKVEFVPTEMIQSIYMEFKTIDFNCTSCKFPKSVERLIFSTSGVLKAEFKEYEFIDLRK